MPENKGNTTRPEPERESRPYISVINSTLCSFSLQSSPEYNYNMGSKQKTIIVGAGPVGALAAIYAAQRGHDVEVYELRNGTHLYLKSCCSCFPSRGLSRTVEAKAACWDFHACFFHFTSFPCFGRSTMSPSRDEPCMTRSGDLEVSKGWEWHSSRAR